MKQVTLTTVIIKPQETKWGMKEKIAIKTQEHGDKWLSSFKVNADMRKWREGDTVSINVTEKGDFLNFDVNAFGASSQPSSASQDLVKAVAELTAWAETQGFKKDVTIEPVADMSDDPFDTF